MVGRQKPFLDQTPIIRERTEFGQISPMFILNKVAQPIGVLNHTDLHTQAYF